MAEFESLKTVRGAKMSDLSIHVADVLAITLAEEDEYQVGKLALSSYDFVPYAMSGLAAAMQTPSSGGRASTTITVPLADDEGGSTSVARNVTLFGPGDVLGVDPAQIIRRYPSPGSTNAEETFHAHIEFDRPELPWAFSAHTPGDQIPAWLALVVLERHEIEWEPATAGLQPIMLVASDRLPPLGSAWAWAHAQASSGAASLTARLSTAWAPANVSRMLAARVLTQNTNYVACLVPTTEAGRNAGLGLGGGTLAPAWASASGTVRLPVYDRWEFRTAPDGDFARLARRLQGVPAPWAIGRRIMDASTPGAPLTDLGPNDAGRRQVIKCALFSPAPQPPDVPGDDVRWSEARTAELKTAVERAGIVEGTAGLDPGAIPNLPIVGPRLYAKGQRATSTVPAGDWFAQVNLAPTNRVVAGLGTRVVVKDQEPLMQAAWSQVGEIEAANRALMLAELARNLATTMHRRLAKIDPGRLLQLTRPVASRVRIDGAVLTLAGQTARSATPVVALEGSLRRTLRPAGAISRRLAPAERGDLSRLVASKAGVRNFQRSYRELDGIGGLSVETIATLDRKNLAAAFATSQTKAVDLVTNAAKVLSAGPTLASAVSTPSLWREPDTTFRPGIAAAERITAKITDQVRLTKLGSGAPHSGGIESGAFREHAAVRSLGGLLAGVAVAGVTGSAAVLPTALSLEEGTLTEIARIGATLSTSVRMVPVPSRAGGATMMRSATTGRSFGSGAMVRSFGAGSLDASDTGIGAARAAAVGPLARPGRGAALVTAANVVTPAAAAGPASPGERLERFITPSGTALATWLELADRVTVHDIRNDIAALIESTGALALAPTPARSTLDVNNDQILRRLEPNRTVVDTMRARLHLGSTNFDVFADSVIRPIMAAPRFDRPMYRALDSYDREWLVPGLGDLPEPELVTLLSTNDEFTETFLVGLSDEMGRELLWRNYPTDQRGTYFYRFWDAHKDELAQQIHRFSAGPLGSHVTVGPPGQSGRAVVVIRGELVRRYPDLTVMALRESGRDADGRPLLPEAPTGRPDAAPSVFHAMLPPDIMLAGLDIGVAELRQPGWWIVLAEHPQATRFRRTEPDLAAHEVRFAAPGGAGNGAAVASERLENPTRIAFEAGDFLPSAT